MNAPSDIVTVGAYFLADGIRRESSNRIQTRVFHSGMLSGGKGEAEIEMCQQGTIEMHITSTALLANLVQLLTRAALLAALVAQLEREGSLLVEGETLSQEDILLSREASAGGAVDEPLPSTWTRTLG